MEKTNRRYIYLLQLTNEKGDKVYKIKTLLQLNMGYILYYFLDIYY